MKALKVIGRILLTVIFIVLIFCIVVVCTYTLGTPKIDKGSDSRSIITGPWESLSVKGEDTYKFTFTQGGEFVVEINGEQAADGYFKIQEGSTGSGKLKLFMLPGHHTAAFEKYVKYKVLGEISYSGLKCELSKEDKIDKENPPQSTFLLKAQDGASENVSVKCEMNEVTIDLYSSEHDLTKNTN